MGETVAKHGQWIEDHELRCDQRYAGIQKSIDEMQSVLRGLQGTLRGAAKIGVGVLLSMVAWLAVQLYSGQQTSNAASEAAVQANRSRITALEERQSPPVTVVQQNPPGK